MKSLVVEDDLISRTVLKEMLKVFGTVNCVTNGFEAITDVENALTAGNYYDLICLDIMMPEMDGQTVLKKIRAIEEQYALVVDSSAKILMTSALNDFDHIRNSYANLCDGYLVKPIDKNRLVLELRKLELIQQ
ncbi:MAG: response regulator [Fibrobacter sp.]|nr:response regulator [Fibrobacter sp.]